jgi:hypothetical protein
VWAGLRSIARSLLGAEEVSQNLSPGSRSPSGSSWIRYGGVLPGRCASEFFQFGVRIALGRCFAQLVCARIVFAAVLGRHICHRDLFTVSSATFAPNRGAVSVARKPHWPCFPSSVQSFHAERTTRRSNPDLCSFSRARERGAEGGVSDASC